MNRDQKRYFEAGKVCFEKGKKYTTQGCCGWCLNWRKAGSYFEDAVKNYEKALPVSQTQYVEACLCCGDAMDNDGDYGSAGVFYEKAGLVQKKYVSDRVGREKAANSFNRAYNMFRMAGQPDRSARMLMTAAGIIMGDDPRTSMKYMSDACCVFEDERRGMFSLDTFREAISFAIRSEMYEDAISLLLRQDELYFDNIKTFENDLYKNMLSIIVIRLYIGAVRDAKVDMESFKSMSGLNFMVSQYGSAAKALLDAYLAENREEFDRVSGWEAFAFLPYSVAGLVRRINVNVGQVEDEADTAIEMSNMSNMGNMTSMVDINLDEPNLQ